MSPAIRVQYFSAFADVITSFRNTRQERQVEGSATHEACLSIFFLPRLYLKLNPSNASPGFSNNDVSWAQTSGKSKAPTNIEAFWWIKLQKLQSESVRVKIHKCKLFNRMTERRKYFPTSNEQPEFALSNECSNRNFECEFLIKLKTLANFRYEYAITKLIEFTSNLICGSNDVMWEARLHN